MLRPILDQNKGENIGNMIGTILNVFSFILGFKSTILKFYQHTEVVYYHTIDGTLDNQDKTKYWGFTKINLPDNIFYYSFNHGKCIFQKILEKNENFVKVYIQKDTHTLPYSTHAPIYVCVCIYVCMYVRFSLEKAAQNKNRYQLSTRVRSIYKFGTFLSHFNNLTKD